MCSKTRTRTRSRAGKKEMEMHVTKTTTTLPHLAAYGEPICVFHSNDEDISTADERDRAAKNLVPSRSAQYRGPSGEPLNIVAWQNGHRDSFRGPSCAWAVHSCHTRRHWGNSNRGRRCSIRSQDHAGHRRPGVGSTRDDVRRGLHDASTVVAGALRRIVSPNVGAVLADSEFDDDP